jgi:hypothetical protein
MVYVSPLHIDVNIRFHWSTLILNLWNLLNFLYMNLEKVNFINSNISTIVANASHYYRPLGTLSYVILLVFSLRTSLGTPFSHGIFIFPKEISSFFLGKIRISWENVVPKLALTFFVYWTCILERTIFNIFSNRGQPLLLLSKNNIMCVLRCFSAWMLFVIICIIYVSVRLVRFSILLLC